VRRIGAAAFVFLAVAIGASGPSGVRPAASASGSASFRVIVNVANPSASVDRKFVADAFLKKTTRWPNDVAIRPVDLGAESAVRHRFCQDVLRRSVTAVDSYWQQLIFSGRDVPPPQLETDEQIVKFVVRYPGGIGYVSAEAALDGVKAVEIR
jgi:ABC-type phosphate transport system substrate-binding protein